MGSNGGLRGSNSEVSCDGRKLNRGARVIRRGRSAFPKTGHNFQETADLHVLQTSG